MFRTIPSFGEGHQQGGSVGKSQSLLLCEGISGNRQLKQLERGTEITLIVVRKTEDLVSRRQVEKLTEGFQSTKSSPNGGGSQSCDTFRAVHQDTVCRKLELVNSGKSYNSRPFQVEDRCHTSLEQ